MSTAIDMHAYGLVQLYLKVQMQLLQRLSPLSSVSGWMLMILVPYHVVGGSLYDTSTLLRLSLSAKQECSHAKASG